ncbi:MAG: zinc-binding dehydrogenase, partial [Chloroflexota bacterium]
ITGLGPVGLGAVVNAHFRGARIIAVESVSYRVERAKMLGAEIVVNPKDDDCLAQIQDLTDGKGVDKALDCSGNVLAQRLCIDALRRRGEMAFVGAGNQELALREWTDLIMKGLTLHGSWHYNLNRYNSILQVIRQSPMIQHLVSHEFPMSDIQTAFETSASQACAKIILNPWE